MTAIKRIKNWAKALQKVFVITGIVYTTGCNVFPEPGTGASAVETLQKLTLVTWNIQAVFDGNEEGSEYDEYLNSAGWSAEKYKARLSAIAQGVDQMAETPPDILALQEVENPEVLKDLVEGPLAKHGYRWTFFAANSGASLGIGIISRFPFIKTTAHSVFYNAEATPRPVLEVWIAPEDSTLALFACHWKSKLEGAGTTEILRRASARVITRRLREIQAEQPGTPVIIMGDLNENYDEFYRQAGTVFSALLPDDPKAAELSGFSAAEEPETAPPLPDFLVISRQKPPKLEYFRSGPLAFYSPWGNELQKGSYNYKNEWETIDHFLLTEELFDHQNWDFDSGGVLDKEPFINGNGYPNTYNPRTGYGISDHLPLLLKLTLY
jgi:endonuclease/exonuclease/phosphatase family metal-dependent hydrolase